MRDKKIANRIFVEKPEGMRPHGRLKRRYKIFMTSALCPYVCDTNFGRATGWTIRVQSPERVMMRYFLFATASRPAPGPTQPPVQYRDKRATWWNHYSSGVQ